MWPNMRVNFLKSVAMMASSASNVGKNTATSSRATAAVAGAGTARQKLKANSTISTKKGKVSSGRSSAFDVRPKSTTASLPDGASSPSRKLAPSSSDGNVNVQRNIRQHRPARNSQTDERITTAFRKLAIQDRKSASSVQPTRRSSSASNGAGSHVCKSLDDVARWILTKKCHNIVVMAGAGISTPSGIPDFRSPGSGLYDNLQQYNIPYPEAIFDIGFFHRDPRPFFTLAKELYPGTYRPNYVHYFVRMLHDKGILLRMYTQNIDGLERMAGVPAAKLVEAHGTFATSSCTRCGQKHDGEETKKEIMRDKIPVCKQKSCMGKIKPDIVFFGEDLPKRFFYYLKDFAQCDLVIVMGTSLEVQPFAGIVNSARSYIPRLLINREAVGPFARPHSGRFNDVAVTGDLVECVQRFTRILGWKKAMQELIEEQEAKLDHEFGPRMIHDSPSHQRTDDANDGKLISGGSTNHSARGSSHGYKANSCQSIEALKGHTTKTGPSSKNYHTLAESTTPVNSNFKSFRSWNVESSTKKCVALPRLSTKQTVPPKYANLRGKSSLRTDSSDSSDTSSQSSSGSDPSTFVAAKVLSL